MYTHIMDIDLDLYRHEVRVSTNPLVRLSAIDISPDHPQRTFVFIHGFGGKAEQWQYQMQTFSVDNRVIALMLKLASRQRDAGFEQIFRCHFANYVNPIKILAEIEDHLHVQDASWRMNTPPSAFLFCSDNPLRNQQ